VDTQILLSPATGVGGSSSFGRNSCNTSWNLSTVRLLWGIRRDSQRGAVSVGLTFPGNQTSGCPSPHNFGIKCLRLPSHHDPTRGELSAPLATP
jgi:hypothetical protein